jgi:hypothetical protein
VGARKEMEKIKGIQFERDGMAEEHSALLAKTNAVTDWIKRPQGATLKKIQQQERIEADNLFLQSKFKDGG